MVQLFLIIKYIDYMVINLKRKINDIRHVSSNLIYKVRTNLYITKCYYVVIAINDEYYFLDEMTMQTEAHDV